MADEESYSRVETVPVGDSGLSEGTREPPVASQQPCSSTSRVMGAATNQDGSHSTPALQVAGPNTQPATSTGATRHTRNRAGGRTSRADGGRLGGFSSEEIRLLEMCLTETKALTVADYESMVAPLYNEYVDSLVITKGTGRR